MPAYISRLNLVDVDDVARGHLLAMQKGRQGRHTFSAAGVAPSRKWLDSQPVTGVKAPSGGSPRLAISALAYANQWIANHDRRAPVSTRGG